jgi:hypothetical protein
MKLEFYQQMFEKYTNIISHEYASNGSRVVPCGRTVRRTDLTKLIVAFLNFVNAHKTYFSPIIYIYIYICLSFDSHNKAAISVKEIS